MPSAFNRSNAFGVQLFECSIVQGPKCLRRSIVQIPSAFNCSNVLLFKGSNAFGVQLFKCLRRSIVRMFYSSRVQMPSAFNCSNAFGVQFVRMFNCSGAQMPSAFDCSNVLLFDDSDTFGVKGFKCFRHWRS